MILISHQKKYLLLIVISIVMFIPFKTIKAQSCNGLVPPTIIHGISVTSTTTGSSWVFPNAYTSCGLYTTPPNSMLLGVAGPFTHALNFSSPINCLDFILTGAGLGGNEDFTFTTNTGIPSITDNGSCFTTITGNLILSGAGSTITGQEGAGNFTIINSQPFVTLTITGGGGLAGTLFAICESSFIPITILEDSISICMGDSIYLEGSYQSSAGIYDDTIYGGSNCTGNTINRTTLTIKPTPTLTISPITDQCENNDSTTLVGFPTGGTFSGNGVSGTNFNPSIAGSGTHTITYHYTDSSGCSGSEYIDIIVKPVPPLTFESVDDVCINDNIVNLIGAPTGGVFSGNGVTGNSFNPITAGIGSHTLSYEYSFPNGCTSIKQIIVNVNEIPIPSFSGDSLLGCEVHTVMFKDNTGFTNENCTWDFGDGTTSNDCDSVLHTYVTAGLYDVTLTIESEEGCIGTTTLIDYIEVFNGPTASFSASPMIIDYDNTEVQFTNESINASGYIWDFGDFSNQVFDINPTHSFPKGTINNFNVVLYAEDSLGCIDSTSLMIKVIFPDLKYDIPNVFTPNADGDNDFFQLIDAKNIIEIEVKILNRWGNLVFQSNDVNFNWNGQIKNAGEECTDGTYFYKLTLKDLNGKEVDEHGFVQLSRGE